MMRSGPHQTTIGKRDARQVATEALSVSGQYAGGPSGERDQWWLRMRAPILPPPSRKPRGLGLTIDIDMHNTQFTLRPRVGVKRGHVRMRSAQSEPPLICHKINDGDDLRSERS